MANQFRAPTFSNQQRKPPQSPAFVGANLLVTTLAAAVVLPFVSAATANVPQHPSHALSANPDTSHGTPKTLYGDATSPVFDAAHFYPLNPRALRSQPQDTSGSSPLVLVRPPDQIASAQSTEALPVYRQPVTPTNTSFRASTLLDLTISAPPVVNAPAWALPRLLWQPENTSAGTPKTLYGDSTAPVFNPAQLLAYQFRPVRDTSASSPKVLLDTVVVPPFINVPPAQAPERKFPLGDTSQGTPKALTVDATAPFYNAAALMFAAIEYRSLTSYAESNYSPIDQIPPAPTPAPTPAPSPAPAVQNGPGARYDNGRGNYIVKGKLYRQLTNEQLAYLLARDMIDTRAEVKVVYKNKKPHIVSKNAWQTLQETMKSLELNATPFDDDEEAAAMLLL